jgi:hypothetical protein
MPYVKYFGSRFNQIRIFCHPDSDLELTSSRIRTGCKIMHSWRLNGSAPDCCSAVPGSKPPSPQPTAECQSPGGLPPGMALGCGLTSVRGNRGKNDKMNRWFAKNIQRKKNYKKYYATKSSYEKLLYPNKRQSTCLNYTGTYAAESRTRNRFYAVPYYLQKISTRIWIHALG